MRSNIIKEAKEEGRRKKENKFQTNQKNRIAKEANQNTRSKERLQDDAIRIKEDTIEETYQKEMK